MICNDSPATVQFRRVISNRAKFQWPLALACALGSAWLYRTLVRVVPKIGSAEPTGVMPVHVDAAAWATLLAVERAATGVFNVGDDCGYASSARARDEFGWTPEMRVSAPA